MELWKKVRIPLDKAREYMQARLRGEEPTIEAEAGGEGEEHKLQYFKRLPWKKILVTLLIAVGAVGFTVAAATIISNILSGTTAVTGLTISAQSSPLIPGELAIGTAHQNTIVVDNPADAALTGRFVFNFTVSLDNPSPDDIQVWVDLDGNGIETDEELTGVVHGNVIQFKSSAVTIPAGSSNWLIQVKFVDSGLVGTNVSWKVYVEAS